MNVTRTNIPSGDAGTTATISRMRGLVAASLGDPTIRDFALAMTDGWPREFYPQRVRAALQAQTQFQRDPSNVELLQSPKVMVRRILKEAVIRIDCDDAAMLAASVGMNLGLVARFVVVDFGRGWAHIWTDLRDPQQKFWVDQDVTRTAQSFDWTRVKRKQIVRL